MSVLLDLLRQGIQWVLVLALAPILIGVIRKVKARLLRRQGASIFQPWRDILRLFRKEVIIADNASWIYRFAPYIIFALTWVAASLVPTFATGLIFSWSADLIVIASLLGGARFFSPLRAWILAQVSVGLAQVARSCLAHWLSPP